MEKDEVGHTTHRSVELLDTLRRLGGSARTRHLSDVMGVSEETVRRTIKKLSKDGLVARVHGGVFLVGNAPVSSFHQRLGKHSDAKRRMARAVAAQVPDGASIFLDVGSTTTFVAEALRERSKLLIVTNSLTAAQSLVKHNGNRVFLAGGELFSDKSGTFGSDALEFAARFSTDMAILSCDAIDAASGFLLNDKAEADLARVFVSHARRRLMVADHSKNERMAPMLACNPADIDVFVTDRLPPETVATAFEKWGIDVQIAPEKKKKKP